MAVATSLAEPKAALRLRSPVEIEEKTGAVYHPYARAFSLSYFGQVMLE